ncbi:MAG: siroheme synthase CysG [Pseudomonadota bacterium]|nr:siroheme synthase CysG [Pseudomonadota bacterium]
MQYFPVFLDMASAKVLIVGGGVVAERKWRLLAKTPARVEIIAPELTAALREAADTGVIDWQARAFVATDVGDQRLVIAATADPEVNHAVAHAARRASIPVNVVDDRAACTAITPAIVERGELVVAISSQGAMPVLARRVRERIEQALPQGLGAFIATAGRYRDRVRAQLAPERVRGFWERLVDGLWREGFAESDARLAQRIDAALERSGDGAATPPGRVTLVGGGPGDPGLLTLRALRRLQDADVVLFDRLVNQALLDLVRRDAERIHVGKRRDRHTVPQSDINALMIEHARAGKQVVRLKGGDPFIFGRGGEEIADVAAAGLQVEVVPGITAAAGCAAYAGIPLTHRDHAQSCMLVTGHRKANGVLELPWTAMAAPQQTLVVYMGLATLGELSQRLIEHGLAPDHPCAMVEAGTLQTQRVVTGTLATIQQSVTVAELTGPALLIVGTVVTLRQDLAWFDQAGSTA